MNPIFSYCSLLALISFILSYSIHPSFYSFIYLSISFFLPLSPFFSLSPFPLITCVPPLSCPPPHCPYTVLTLSPLYLHSIFTLSSPSPHPPLLLLLCMSHAAGTARYRVATAARRATPPPHTRPRPTPGGDRHPHLVGACGDGGEGRGGNVRRRGRGGEEVEER